MIISDFCYLLSVYTHWWRKCWRKESTQSKHWKQHGWLLVNIKFRYKLSCLGK